MCSFKCLSRKEVFKADSSDSPFSEREKWLLQILPRLSFLPFLFSSDVSAVAQLIQSLNRRIRQLLCYRVCLFASRYFQELRSSSVSRLSPRPAIVLFPVDPSQSHKLSDYQSLFRWTVKFKCER